MLLQKQMTSKNDVHRNTMPLKRPSGMNLQANDRQSQANTSLVTSVEELDMEYQDSQTRLIKEGYASRMRRDTVINPNPPYQRENAINPKNMSVIDDGYDSENMQKLATDMKNEVESLKKTCFQQIEARLGETEATLTKKIESIDLSCKSLITETQIAVSAIQVDMDKLIEKMRSSQSEILMINKNLAANLKKQRTEISEI